MYWWFISQFFLVLDNILKTYLHTGYGINNCIVFVKFVFPNTVIRKFTLSHSEDSQNCSQLLLVEAILVISAAFFWDSIFVPFPWVSLNGSKFSCKISVEDSGAYLFYVHHHHDHQCLSSRFIILFFIENILSLKELRNFSFPSKSNPEFLKKHFFYQLLYFFSNSAFLQFF